MFNKKIVSIAFLAILIPFCYLFANVNKILILSDTAYNPAVPEKPYVDTIAVSDNSSAKVYVVVVDSFGNYCKSSDFKWVAIDNPLVAKVQSLESHKGVYRISANSSGVSRQIVRDTMSALTSDTLVLISTINSTSVLPKKRQSSSRLRSKAMEQYDIAGRNLKVNQNSSSISKRKKLNITIYR